MIVFTNMHRTLLTLLIGVLLATITPSIADARMPDAPAGRSFEDWIIQTPMSIRGRFVFITRISRRRLRAMVFEMQRPILPVALPLLRAEI